MLRSPGQDRGPVRRKAACSECRQHKVGILERFILIHLLTDPSSDAMHIIKITRKPVHAAGEWVASARFCQTTKDGTAT
jgi:hypothetical protein